MIRQSGKRFADKIMRLKNPRLDNGRAACKAALSWLA
jgi:hypothetical protein